MLQKPVEARWVTQTSEQVGTVAVITLHTDNKQWIVCGKLAQCHKTFTLFKKSQKSGFYVDFHDF